MRDIDKRHRFFCFDGEDYNTYETEAEAVQAAEDGLEFNRDNACEGWAEETDQIIVGRITHQVTETERRDRTDEDWNVDASCDEIVDYALIPFTEA